MPGTVFQKLEINGKKRDNKYSRTDRLSMSTCISLGPCQSQVSAGTAPGRHSDSAIESATFGSHQVDLIRLNPAFLTLLFYLWKKTEPHPCHQSDGYKNRAFGSKTTDSMKPTASPLKQHNTLRCFKINFSSKSNKTQEALSAQ